MSAPSTAASPGVATAEEIEDLFDPEQAIDLYYDVVYPRTEWPTYAKSVKALAQFCGFAWRDANPSGAASIQWFNEYCRERDPEKLQRILDYNEDDCQAMAVLKSYLEELPAQEVRRRGAEGNSVTLQLYSLSCAHTVPRRVDCT